MQKIGPINRDFIRSNIRKLPDLSGCWYWTYCIHKTGYGVFGTDSKAHRISYELFNGPITDNLFVLHKCDVRSCVNPDHLFLGTNYDNMKDMANKDRAKGKSTGDYAKFCRRGHSRSPENLTNDMKCIQCHKIQRDKYRAKVKQQKLVIS